MELHQPIDAVLGQTATRSVASISRSRRVMVVLIGVVALSLADLIATLTHLRTVGMVEANPIAWFIIDSTGSALSLTCYKLLTVAICVLLLYRLRHSIQSEVGSWVCLLVLVTLTVYWGHYAKHASSSELITTLHGTEQPHARWVTLVD